MPEQSPEESNSEQHNNSIQGDGNRAVQGSGTQGVNGSYNLINQGNDNTIIVCPLLDQTSIIGYSSPRSSQPTSLGRTSNNHIGAAYFPLSSDAPQVQSLPANNTKSEQEIVSPSEQNITLPQQPQKILEPSLGANLNININTHATTLSSCQEYISQLKVYLHRIYRNTSGATSQVSKSDLRHFIQLLSDADELISQVWQEVAKEEDEQ